jgi:hypothetical protein
VENRHRLASSSTAATLAGAALEGIGAVTDPDAGFSDPATHRVLWRDPRRSLPSGAVSGIGVAKALPPVLLSGDAGGSL